MEELPTERQAVAAGVREGGVPIVPCSPIGQFGLRSASGTSKVAQIVMSDAPVLADQSACPVVPASSGEISTSRNPTLAGGSTSVVKTSIPMTPTFRTHSDRSQSGSPRERSDRSRGSRSRC